VLLFCSVGVFWRERWKAFIFACISAGRALDLGTGAGRRAAATLPSGVDDTVMFVAEGASEVDLGEKLRKGADGDDGLAKSVATEVMGGVGGGRSESCAGDSAGDSTGDSGGDNGESGALCSPPGTLMMKSVVRDEEVQRREEGQRKDDKAFDAKQVANERYGRASSYMSRNKRSRFAEGHWARNGMDIEREVDGMRCNDAMCCNL
jgi:hypothetical protein